MPVVMRAPRLAATIFALMLAAVPGVAQPGDRGAPLDFPRGANVTLEVRDAPLVDVLRLICDQGGVSLVASDVEGLVTTRLIDVSLEDAFLQLVVGEGLAFRQHGDVVTVWRE